jgi:hypothetical protein
VDVGEESRGREERRGRELKSGFGGAVGVLGWGYGGGRGFSQKYMGCVCKNDTNLEYQLLRVEINFS